MGLASDHFPFKFQIKKRDGQNLKGKGAEERYRLKSQISERQITERSDLMAMESFDGARRRAMNKRNFLSGKNGVHSSKLEDEPGSLCSRYAGSI
jgi:hypothetical protein